MKINTSHEDASTEDCFYLVIFRHRIGTKPPICFIDDKLTLDTETTMSPAIEKLQLTKEQIDFKYHQQCQQIETMMSISNRVREQNIVSN